jgi:ketosteroid isomerase-like protein
MASAAGEDAVYRRLLMTDNSSETGMRDCIKQAAAAASQEDLETYVSCFTDSQRKPLRRKAALLFVQHTVTLELIDCHLVAETESHATWAIKYKALLTDAGYDVVSLLHMHKENNEWKIRREEVEASERSQPVTNRAAVVPVGCAGGQCRLVPQ